MEVEVLGNVMTVKSGVMKSGQALIDGTECTLKLTPELLMYESPIKQGSIFLRSIRAVGVDTDELVLDYEKNRFELARIKIKPTSDITLFHKRKEWDNQTKHRVVVGDDEPEAVGGGIDTWLAEWYATLGCGLGDVSGFDTWVEEADAANERGEKAKSVWVSPIAFLYDQVTIEGASGLFERVYETWKNKVNFAAIEASPKNPIYPNTVINFTVGSDFHNELALNAILEKSNGLGIDGWNNIDMINVSNYSIVVQRYWAKLKYLRFMLIWINFRSGHAYSDEYGLWPEQYQQFFMKAEVISKSFVTEQDGNRVREFSRNVEMDSSYTREYPEDVLKEFKQRFLTQS
jgi:hypothetical protein